MSEGEKSGEARRALVDSVKGKAKEIFGAVTGNDSLTAEGQLDQTDAKERREAARAESEADAEAAQAESLAEDAKRKGSEQRLSVGAEAEAVAAQVRSEQSAVKSAVDEAGRRDAVREQTKADMDALSENIRAKDDERAEVRAAVDEYSDAVDEHRHSVNESVRTQAEANQLRRRAEVIDHSDPA